MPRSGGTWLPGQSGNPKGRPRKELCITDHLRRILAEVGPDGESTHAEMLARTLVNQAIKGDYRSIREVMDRVEGRTVQQMEFVNPPVAGSLAQQVENMLKSVPPLDPATSVGGTAEEEIPDDPGA